MYIHHKLNHAKAQALIVKHTTFILIEQIGRSCIISIYRCNRSIFKRIPGVKKCFQFRGHKKHLFTHFLSPSGDELKITA